MYSDREKGMFLDMFSESDRFVVVEFSRKCRHAKQDILNLCEKLERDGVIRVEKGAYPKMNKIVLTPDRLQPVFLPQPVCLKKMSIRDIFSEAYEDEERTQPVLANDADMLYDGPTPKRDFSKPAIQQIMELMASGGLPKPVTDDTHFRGYPLDSYPPEQRASIKQKIDAALGRHTEDPEIQKLERELEYTCSQALSCDESQLYIYTAAIGALMNVFANKGHENTFVCIHRLF
jgi:hypothetical protein